MEIKEAALELTKLIYSKTDLTYKDIDDVIETYQKCYTAINNL